MEILQLEKQQEDLQSTQIQSGMQDIQQMLVWIKAAYIQLKEENRDALEAVQAEIRKNREKADILDTDTGRKAGDPSEDSFRQHFPKDSGYPETGNTAGRVKETD